MPRPRPGRWPRSSTARAATTPPSTSSSRARPPMPMTCSRSSARWTSCSTATVRCTPPRSPLATARRTSAAWPTTPRPSATACRRSPKTRWSPRSRPPPRHRPLSPSSRRIRSCCRRSSPRCRTRPRRRSPTTRPVSRPSARPVRSASAERAKRPRHETVPPARPRRLRPRTTAVAVAAAAVVAAVKSSARMGPSLLGGNDVRLRSPHRSVRGELLREHLAPRTRLRCELLVADLRGGERTCHVRRPEQRIRQLHPHPARRRSGTGYAHIVGGGIYVSYGQRVSAGEQIAATGQTGNSFGCHLHFEVYPPWGGTTDPAPWLRDRGVWV